MRRTSNGVRVAALSLITVVAACNRSPAGSAPEPEHAGRVGDSTAFGVRILGFNGPRDRAKFSLEKPAYVVALAVVPGGGIEPVSRRPVPDTALESSGEHNVWIRTPRVGVRASAARSSAQLEYDKCLAQQNTVGARAQVVARRDSTGRVVSETSSSGGPGYHYPPESQCRHLQPQMRSGTSVGEMADPNRFLVLIASNVRLTEQELLQRLDTINVDAKDVQTTIAGIAGALYSDRQAVWSGYYKRW